MNEFESICPYNDEEAVKALGKVANHPAVFAISEYLFPDRPVTYLRDALKSVRSIDEFQEKVMNDAVLWCIEHTMDNFTYDGISYIKGIKGKFLAMSNHRDIILDPAITQMVFFRNKRGHVLVQLLYNERETSIPALPAATGNFYDWNVLRAYLKALETAIPDDNIVRDTEKKQRSGVA